MTVKDVSSHDFVIAYAAHLKRIGKIEVPKWADLVKTSTHKELAPYDPDWYYIRAAAIARRVYLRGGIGVGAFKRIFGGRISRGTRPEKFATGSGSVCRHILKEVSGCPAQTKVDQGWIGRQGGTARLPPSRVPFSHRPTCTVPPHSALQPSTATSPPIPAPCCNAPLGLFSLCRPRFNFPVAHSAH